MICLEKFVGKKIKLTIIPFDSPLYGQKLPSDIPFHNEETLVGVLERNNGSRSHYALRLENGEGVALVDEQIKWIFNVEEVLL